VKTRFLQRVFTFNDVFLRLYGELWPQNLSICITLHIL